MKARYRVLALILFAGIAGPAPAAADGRWALQARRLFPTLESVRPEVLDLGTRRWLEARRGRSATCGADAPCVLRAARWADADRERLAASVAAQVGPAERNDRRAAVLRELAGLDSLIGVYGLGESPPYPKIDGPIAAAGPGDDRPTAVAIDLARAGAADPATVLDPSIGLALALLDVNDRDDASAFEPLDTGANAAANARARTLDWRRWPHTAIIVPGIGPDDLATALSARGKLNVRLAAELFATGVAPFIIVSGGSVHPRGSRFVEAVEMRRALMDRFGVPADAIVLEPYARHTTTNLRNASRRLAALGAPRDGTAVISTNEEQSRYIAGPEFAGRNRAELGYEPGMIGCRLSSTRLLFTPSAASLAVDPHDPLDP